MTLYDRFRGADSQPVAGSDPPPEPPEPLPVPPGVKGYVVACVSGKTNLTHCTPMGREEAEAEAATWRKADQYGARYVVWELREAS